MNAIQSHNQSQKYENVYACKEVMKTETERPLSPAEAGAEYIVEQVDMKAGIRGRTKEHKSRGFHCRVWMVIGKAGIEEALGALQQAYDAARSGDGESVRDPYGYFGKIAKNIAKRKGLEI